MIEIGPNLASAFMVLFVVLMFVGIAYCASRESDDE
jgi:hypothetical protein